MASIKRRGESFQITVSLGYDANGKKIRKTTTFTPPENVTEKKAEKLAREFAFDFEKRCKGMTELNENMRFVDLVDWYFENYAAHELKSVTVYNYDVQLKKHVIPVFGNYKLKDFSSAKLTEFFSSLQLSPASCKKLYIVISSVFTVAQKHGFINANPCKNATIPKDRRTRMDKKSALTESQVKVLMSMCEGYSEFNTVIKTLLYTGMRAGECLALQWEDVDYENSLIHIRHNLADVNGKHWLDTPKTGSSIRYIGMSSALKTLLKEHQERQEEKKKALGKAYMHPTMVFTNELGNYVDRNRLNRLFKKFVSDTDFSHISLHSLRHCTATLLINSGVDLKIVSELLGHADVNVTASVYADVLDSAKAKVAEIVALQLGDY